MPTIAFDAGTINERGTAVAVFDYADHLERLGLGKAIMLFDPESARTSPAAVTRFRERFDLYPKPADGDLADFLARKGATVLYRLTSGLDDGRYIDGVRNVNHAVFRHDEPHGDRYAYVSEWLSRHMTGGRRPWVPHIVSMPEPRRSLRDEWDVPASATLLGRHGGFDQFNLPFAPRAIARALERRKDLWFVFLNTKPFIAHERVRFLPAILDVQGKADFIGSCDGMIHARKIGESFGLAMAEFLALDKPVVCWAGGADRHHLSMQPELELVYHTEGELVRILRNFGKRGQDGLRRRAVAEFAPDHVMRRFQQVFLGDMESSLEPTPSIVRLSAATATRLIRARAEIWLGLSKVGL